MSRHALIVLATVMSLHGILHLLGFAAYWRLAEIDGLPYKTAFLSGRIHIGDLGTRALGAAFLAAGLGFVTAAFGLLVDVPWWRPLLIAATLLSLVVTVLDWQVAYVGALIDVLVLFSILVSARL